MITLHVRPDKGDVVTLTANEILQTRFTSDNDHPLLDVTIEHASDLQTICPDSKIGTITIICQHDIIHMCPENMQVFEAVPIEKDSPSDVIQSKEVVEEVI